jgi:hypothetical protein
MAYVFTKNFCDILKCRRCGLGRTRLSCTFDPSAYYDEAYFKGGVVDGYSDYVGSADILRAEFRQTLREILPFCHGGRLLEFGCAYGYFLEEAAPYFDSAHGIEYADSAAQACRDRGLHVVTGPVTEDALTGPYDVIVGLDVIEHLPEPQETLRLLSTKMASGGVLVMTTGDWDALLPRIAGARWRLMTPPQHLSFFTPRSIKKVLESAGLRLISLKHPWKRVPLALMAYQLQRMVGVRPRQLSLLNRIALPMNLGDAMRVVAVKDD